MIHTLDYSEFSIKQRPTNHSVTRSDDNTAGFPGVSRTPSLLIQDNNSYKPKDIDGEIKAIPSKIMGLVSFSCFFFPLLISSPKYAIHHSQNLKQAPLSHNDNQTAN